MTRLRLTLSDVALMVLITVCIAIVLALLGEPPRPASIVTLAGARYGETSTLAPAATPGLETTATVVGPRSGGVVAEPSGRKTPRGHIGTALIGGWATYYDDGPGLYAAAGPALRQALGRHWRGSIVRVQSRGHAVVVVIRDFCACGSRHGRPTLLDLSPDAFRALAPLSRGVVAVSVELGRRPVPTAPATDAE